MALQDTHIQRNYDKQLLPGAVFDAVFDKKSGKKRARVGGRAAKKAAEALGDEDDDGKASVAGSDENEDEEEDAELDEEVEEEEEDENDYGDNYFDGGEDDGGEGGDALGGGGDEGELSCNSNLEISLTIRCDRWWSVLMSCDSIRTAKQIISAVHKLELGKDESFLLFSFLFSAYTPFFRDKTMASSPLVSSTIPAPPYDTTLEHEDSQEDSVFFGQATESWAKAEQRLLDKAGNRRDTIVPLKLGGTGKEILLNQTRISNAASRGQSSPSSRYHGRLLTFSMDSDSLLIEEEDSDEAEYNSTQSNSIASYQDKENITTSPIRPSPRPSPFNSPNFLHSINKTPLLLSALSNAPSPLRFYNNPSPIVLGSPRPLSTLKNAVEDVTEDEEISIDGLSIEEAGEVVEEIVQPAVEDAIVESESELEFQELDNAVSDAPLSPALPMPSEPVTKSPDDSSVVEPTTEPASNESIVSETDQESVDSPADSLLVQVDSQESTQELTVDLEETQDAVGLSLEIVSQTIIEEKQSALDQDISEVKALQDELSCVEEVDSDEVEESSLNASSVAQERSVAEAAVAEAAVAEAAVEEEKMEELVEDVSVSEASVEEESPSADVSETEIEEEDAEPLDESADVSLSILEPEVDVEVEIEVESAILIVEETELIEREVSEGDDSGEEFDEESELEADASLLLEEAAEGVTESGVCDASLEQSAIVDSVHVVEVVKVCLEVETLVVETHVDETGSFFSIYRFLGLADVSLQQWPKSRL